jgi:hypothetical protein
VDLLRTLGGVDRDDCGVGVWDRGFVPQSNIALPALELLCVLRNSKISLVGYSGWPRLVLNEKLGSRDIG